MKMFGVPMRMFPEALLWLLMGLYLNDSKCYWHISNSTAATHHGIKCSSCLSYPWLIILW